MSRGPVLVIEDDPDVLTAIVEVLGDNGWAAVGASNGLEGLEVARRSNPKPCLILLDVMMPVLDGWGFRAAQRADPALLDIPVVVLTAHATVEATALQMGAAAHLKKPVHLARLLETVACHCRRDTA